MSSIATVTARALAADTAPAGEVHGAIARAARATGVDFDYLLAQARLESGLDPSARAPTSSARGLYQFTGGTWLRTLDRHAAAHGLDWAGAAARDPALRAQALALRDDPQVSALMAGELANDNRAFLAGVLGRDPGKAELYLAHFLGAEGAGRFLTALASDPGQSAAALLPRAAAANRAIFFDDTGPRSVGAVMALLSARLEAAMNGAGALDYDTTGLDGPAFAAPGGFMPAGYGAAPAPPAFTGGPVAQAFQAAAQDAPATSMADTLRETFGIAEAGGGGAASPAHVRSAYAALRAFGM